MVDVRFGSKRGFGYIMMQGVLDAFLYRIREIELLIWDCIRNRSPFSRVNGWDLLSA